MEIESVTFATRKISEMRTFYSDTLELPLVRDDSLDVRAGSTVLSFESGESGTYHFAFRVDAPIESVASWLEQRISLHDYRGEKVIHFEFIDADVVYFDDPAGNVLEFVSYADHASHPFTPERIVNVTEVGLPVPNVRRTVDQLESSLGITMWGELGAPEGITRVGNANGRFIVAPTGRPWFPTGRESTVGPITVEADVDGPYEHPTLPYRITPHR